MGRNINTTKLTKTTILNKISQISIFSVYFNIPIDIINYCINTGELIKSPIREDNHPTCGFKYDNKGKLKFKDFAGYFWGDCFDAVALIMSNIYNTSIDISKKEDFVKVLKHIAFTFKDIYYGTEKDNNIDNIIINSLSNIKKQKPIIELVTREWNNNDINYWKQFGINIQDLNINFVYPVEQFYINRKINPNAKYYYDSKDPCYGYLLGKDKSGTLNIKLYFPKRNKNFTKFITNCNHLEGIYGLNNNTYNYIIITKSTKDRISLKVNIDKVFKNNNINNISIGVINIPHETYKLRQNEYNWLISKVRNGFILSFMDNDRTGKLEAKWLKDNYNIKPILINNKEYDAKDFSELISKYGYLKIEELILLTLNNIIDYGENNKHIGFEEKSSDLPF